MNPENQIEKAYQTMLYGDKSPNGSIIYPQAKIVNDHNFTLGALSRIDDFVFINAGQGCHIGRNVHIASFCSVIGGGECIIKDFAGLACGVRIITGSDDFTGSYLTNPTVPKEFTHVHIGKVHIGKHSIIGTNAVIFPDTVIGEGCAIGAGCIVRGTLEPWGIYVGFNPKKVGQRDKESILQKEQEYLSTLVTQHTQ